VIAKHLEVVAESLSRAEEQLWIEPVTILMDRMGIRQASPGEATVELQLRELHNAAGATAVSLPISIPRGAIPKRDIMAEVRRALI
jgi:hypothetical protein